MDWKPHPTAPGYFFKGEEVLSELQLAQRLVAEDTWELETQRRIESVQEACNNNAYLEIKLLTTIHQVIAKMGEIGEATSGKEVLDTLISECWQPWGKPIVTPRGEPIRE